MITNVVVVVVVDHTSYIAKSRASLEALKSANLLKSINLNALIIGQRGTGKETLAKFILPNVKVINAESFSELLSYISSCDTVIIKDFDRISNYETLKKAIELNSVRVIATSKSEIQEHICNDFFSLKITIPPLCERLEDVDPLIKKFFKEISSIFGEYNIDEISLKNLNKDLTDNCYSLRKSVYISYLMSSFDDNDVMQIMEELISKKLGGKNDYRDQLYLFDVPILRAGFKKFNSQLKMSEKFGLNRNTLRKKINDYKDKYILQ